MKLSEYYRENIDNLRKRLINDIFNKVIAMKAIELELNNPPIYQAIDDQFNMVVSRINAETKSFWIYTMNDLYTVGADELTTDTLLLILEAIEDGDCEVFQSISNEVVIDEFSHGEWCIHDLLGNLIKGEFVSHGAANQWAFDNGYEVVTPQK